MTHSGLPRTTRAYIQDAAFHARQLHRSLEAAAAQAHTPFAERKLSKLAATVRGWAVELDPATHSRRRRRQPT